MSRFLVLVVFFTVGCGVKGKPLPPLEPTPIGTGRLQDSEEIQVQSKKKKSQEEQKSVEESAP